MSKTVPGRPRAGSVALACALAPLLAPFAGCGGGDDGVVADPAGTSSTQAMTCTGGCVASGTRSTGELEAHFYIVDDGSRAQAQAGFHSGIALGYNVELDGDSMNFVQGPTSTAMGLPKPGSDPFVNLFDLTGSPYLADFPHLPTSEVTGQFQLVRATQTLTSTVTLPPPFRLTAPGDNATYAKTDDAVPVQLDAAQPDVALQADSANCLDETGSAWQFPGGGTGQYFATTDSRSFTFDAARWFATLKPTRQDGSVAQIQSCTVKVQASLTNDGTLADGFKAGSSISAMQLRSVTINLR